MLCHRRVDVLRTRRFNASNRSPARPVGQTTGAIVVRRRGTDNAVTLRLFAMALTVVLAACGATRSPRTLSQGTIAHGPFEIVAAVRRISTGTWPNQGGSPFDTREVSEFRVLWHGEPVATAGGNDRFWRVLRLEGAPRPALLLVTQGFVLATEEAGALKLQPLPAESNSLAELQWLDTEGGQPGIPQTFGIEAVEDLDAGTRVAGGRWLRLGSRLVVDVPSLAVHAVEPWVPHRPGEPITSLSRDGDEARAFSPRRTQFVLAASGYDYERDGAQACGLLVVDVPSGTAYELRVDRRRFRFADTSDLTAEWITHHFAWTLDGAQRERLVPRGDFTPWPWRGRLRETSPGQWQFDVPRIDARFLAVVHRLAVGLPGFEMGAPQDEHGFDLRGQGCAMRARAFGDDGAAEDRWVAIWLEADRTAPAPECADAIRRLAAAVDAELASGRHDALLQLE